MKKILIAIFLTFTMSGAFAANNTDLMPGAFDDSLNLSLTTLVISPIFDSGNYAVPTDEYEPVPGTKSVRQKQENIKYGTYGIGVDIFTALHRGMRAETGWEIGPWVGADIGWLNVADDTAYIYGNLNIGLALQFKLGRYMHYYIAGGYGIVGTIQTADSFKISNNPSAGFAMMTGVTLSPFAGTMLAPLGINFNFKFLPDMPSVRGEFDKRPDGFAPSLTSFVGLVFRF